MFIYMIKAEEIFYKFEGIRNAYVHTSIYIPTLFELIVILFYFSFKFFFHDIGVFYFQKIDNLRPFQAFIRARYASRISCATCWELVLLDSQPIPSLSRHVLFVWVPTKSK